jgi:hypothetical protein
MDESEAAENPLLFWETWGLHSLSRSLRVAERPSWRLLYQHFGLEPSLPTPPDGDFLQVFHEFDLISHCMG